MRKVRTLRGQITAVGGKADKQLILNDQLINRGLRVTGFFMWPVEASGLQNQSFSGILSYAQLGNANVNMNAGDNTQLGWCYQVARAQQTAGVPPAENTFGASGYGPAPFGFIDPDHIVNRDLFVSIRDADADRSYNYMVVCELMQLTDNEAIITIVKENSQSLV